MPAGDFQSPAIRSALPGPFSPISAWRALAWVAGGVAAFHLAYSSARLSGLVIAYLFALIQLARVRSGRQAFYFGLAAGLLCAAPQLNCFWVLFGPSAVALWLVLGFWLGLFVVLARLCFVRFGDIRGALAVPFLWMGLEYFRSELYYLRFSWLNIGYAFSGSTLTPLFHWSGMYGLGFLAAGFAVALSVLRPAPARLAGLGLALVIGVLLPGYSPVPKTALPGGKGIRVAGVQLEFPIEAEVIAALDDIIKTDPQAELLLLSEYTFDGPIPEKVSAWCRDHQRYLVAGGKAPAGISNFFDTAFVAGPGGEIVFQQVKSVPVQFLKDGLPAAEQRLWDSPWGRIGICICYDLSYTRVTDRLIRLGAQAILVPTMDVVDWGRHEHELHARVARVRAAEYGVPIFRVASSGLSQLVEGSGRERAGLDFPGQHQIISGTMIPASAAALPLDRWLAPIATGLTGLLLGWFLITSRKRGNPSPREASGGEIAPADLRASTAH
jgi:apolipoprotein N-acyltransferase